MQYLFKEWPNLTRIFKSANQILLMADFDGTLAQIVNQPELAKMSNRLHQHLASLARNPHFTVGVLSGRSLLDLKKKINIKELIYAGNHGLEIETPNNTYVHPGAVKASTSLKRAKKELTQALSFFEGVLVEDKGLTLSVHYRLAKPENVPKIKKIFHNKIKNYINEGMLKKTAGKKVLEVRPPIKWDKGSAILWLIEKLNLKNNLPIYLGDDKTDEDAFRALEDKGITIFVGEPTTLSKATYYLNDSHEVGFFLIKLGAIFNHETC